MADFTLFRDTIEESENYCSCVGRLLFNFCNQDSLFTCENSFHLIPSGEYKVIFTRSPRFSRKLPYAYYLNGNVPLVYNRKVVAARGIRIHCGNDGRDSLGCILVGMQLNQFKSPLTGVILTPGILDSWLAYKALCSQISAYNPKLTPMSLDIIDNF